MTKNQASQLVPEVSRRSSSPSESPVARLMKLTPMESEMTLVSILRMIRRRKWTLILSVLILPALAMVGILQTTPRYTATGSVIIEPKTVNIGNIEQVLTQGRPDVRIDSQIEIVRSRGLADRTIERLFLDTRPEFNQPSSSPSGSSEPSNYVYRELGMRVALRGDRGMREDDSGADTVSHCNPLSYP